MPHNKNLDALESANDSNAHDSAENETEQEENLEWLLDMESYDTEDTLFKVEGERYEDQGLSAFEAEMAERPMTRGNDMGDDLANYVDEEIIISSDSSSSDIYSSSDDPASAAASSAEEAGRKMAIDFTRSNETASGSADSVAEGADILGLASEDDMGETYLTIKRVRNNVRAEGKAVTVDEAPVQQAEVVARADNPLVEQDLLDAGVSVGTGTMSAAAGSDLGSTGLHGSDTDLEDLGLDLDSLEDAPVPTQVAQPQDDDVAHQDVLAKTDSDTVLPSDAEDLLTDNNLDEDLTFSIEGGDNELTESFDAFEKDEVVLFETEEANEGLIGALPEGLDDEPFDDLLAQNEQLSSGGDELDQLDELSVRADSADAMSLDIAHDAGNEQTGSDTATHDTDANAEPEGGVASIPEFDMSDFEAEGEPAPVIEDESAAHVELPEVEFDARELEQSAQSLAIDAAEQVAPDSQESSLLDDLPEVEFDEVASEQDLAFEAVTEEFSDISADEIDAILDENVDDSAHLGRMDGVEDGVEKLFVAESAEESIEGCAEDIFGDDFSDDIADELGAALTAEQLEAETDIDSAFSELSDASEEDNDLFSADFDQLAETFDAAAEIDSNEDALFEVQAEVGIEVQTDAQVENQLDGRLEDPIEQPVAQNTPAAEEPITEELLQEQAPLDEPEPEPVGRSAIDLAALDSTEPNWFVPGTVNFSESSKGGGDIFADFLDAFVEEGSSEIEKLEDLVSEWEKDVANEDIAAEVGRTLHTVKGIAKGVGLQRYGTLIHNFETLLEALPTPVDDEEQVYFRIINVWLDAVVRGIESIGATREDVASELPAVAASVEKARSTETPEKETAASKNAQAKKTTARKGSKKKGGATEKADFAAGEDPAADERREQQLADEGAKALTVQQSVRITSDTLDHWLNLASQTQQLCVRASQTNNRGKRSTAELQGRLSSVRTHIGKIADRALLSVNARGSNNRDMDALEMDQYSELQEAASILREGVEDLGDLIELLGRQNNQVEALLKQQSSVISSISSSLQGSRVVPVSRLMPGLRRIVRTVSTDLGKVVTFRVLNEVGALDRDHHARLQVVLEHMVRNALDHGIELPDDRLAAGKPNAGRITVDVVKSGGDYIIKLADDGRGIDADAIRESARKKGLDVDVDSLSDDEAMRLIFHKGFSTVDTVSEISGRGVGMDIVLTELQQLGGDIQIQSAPGQGTTFVVRIPSNVTVNGALMVTAGDDAYAIPLNGLIAVEQVPSQEFFSAVRQGESLRLFDMDCEPAYLATLCQGVGLPERGFWEAFVPVIIAGSEDRHMAIAIDHVQEALELVVRSLGSQFSTVPGLAGAATTADGEAIVALDLNLLVESVGADGIAPIADSKDQHQSLLALVVDDSRTQRMVATSQLDAVGVETATAENGQVAIDLLNATHRLPDVVLLDVEMPVKDGIETLREIRKSQRYGHLPVIMVTSRTGAKHRALAKSAGCNAYMGKPFNFPALVEQINVLTRHNLQLS